MDLAQMGMALVCLCGANMNTELANILFYDKGRVKVGCQQIRCPVCRTIYRRGERLRYRLLIITDES